MLLKLLREEQPDYIAAIFESKEKTFRHETFADYKANRLEMPDDLASQMPYIFRLCEALNIPVINAPGYEADDVIGTLAQKTAEKEMLCVVVSNDKDMRYSKEVSIWLANVFVETKQPLNVISMARR